MVRLWTWEAFAHGAEVVSYFRWRQAPFAQEQMHSGLLRPDSVEAPGFHEAQAVAGEIKALGDIGQVRADVALVVDYPSAWAWEIQPQGREFSYFALVFDFYKALRSLGLSVDIKSSRDTHFDGYGLVAVPGLFAWPDGLAQVLAASGAKVVTGPRSGSKTADFAIPADLPPGLGADLLDVKVTRIETLPANAPVVLKDAAGAVQYWREFAEPGPRSETLMQMADGAPLLMRQGNLHYLAGWADDTAMRAVLFGLLRESGLVLHDLPDEIRLRRAGNLVFAFNYGSQAIDVSPFMGKGEYVLGQAQLPPSGVAAVRIA
jgi:beta-galactosidase